ncbi:MAG TPA: DPP IV N-terminal domain-containing protein, partial [Gemmatimonadaceae bacterium]|nr:DPP IV N-terminal domain-containing protein [Gemmatimonadaceae bacterium]
MRSIIAAAMSVLLAVPALSQETPSKTLFTSEHSLDIERITSPQISPDGKQIIYTRSWVNQMEDKWERALWIINADGSQNRFLVKGSDPRWSPDGARVAYLAEGDPKGSQIFVKWIGTEGPASQITTGVEAPADIRWSPDGKWIGFSMFVPKKPEWKIDMVRPPTGGKWTEAPRIVQQLHFKQDQRGFMEPGYRHLFVVTSEGGTPAQVTSGNWNVGARFDQLDGSVGWSWTPDGKRMVVEGMNDSTADLNYRNSNVYIVDVAGGAPRRLTTSEGQWGSPAVSPDGKWIAFSGYSETHSSYHASEIYVMPIDGGEMRQISGGRDRDP